MRNLIGWCLGGHLGTRARWSPRCRRNLQRFESWITPFSSSPPSRPCQRVAARRVSHTRSDGTRRRRSPALSWQADFWTTTVQDYTQNHRTETKDDIATVFRHMGQPEVYATVGLGTS